MTHDFRAVKDFKFFQTYETASLIESVVRGESWSFAELPWDEPSVRMKLAKFSKVSLLGHYIYTMLFIEKGRDYRKNSDAYDEDDIARLRVAFASYGIPLRNESQFNETIGQHDKFEYFYLWFQYHEESFFELWEKVTDEVFYLLYSNREFLLTFNRSLAAYLSENRQLIPRSHRRKTGKIARTRIPVWVKKAVYFRDQGRCVICGKDVSGLLDPGSAKNFDHMVPLDLWGINDPANIQLLCAECNSKKGASYSSTSSRYRDWW